MGNSPLPDWSHPGKSSGGLLMSPWSAPHLRTVTRASRSAERELRMEMTVGQDQQSGARCNTSHRGRFSRMVRHFFLADDSFCL